MNALDHSIAFKAPGSLDELLTPLGPDFGVRTGQTWAVYSRISRVDPRNPGYSMETQPDHAEEYARAHGAQTILTYADPDCTGKNSKRQGFQNMLRDIKAGKVDVVVVHRLDRLYRNLESLLAFTRLLKKYNVKLVSVTEQIDTTSWWGRLALAVLGHMAESYLHQTSSNTRNGLDARRRAGLHLGHLPLGYCNGLCSTCADVNGKGYCPNFGGPDRAESQRGKIAVPHPVDRHVIPLIFNLYLQGFSSREIAIHLNSHIAELPNGSHIHFRPRRKREKTMLPRSFQKDSIRAILENPFYAGLIARYPRPEFDMTDDVEHPENIPAPNVGRSRDILELHPGKHTPLVSSATWQAVQNLREQKSTTPTTAVSQKNPYLLSGVGRCWECYEATGQDYSLRGSTGGKKTAYYRCAYVHDHALKRAPKKQPRTPGLNMMAREFNTNLMKRHSSLRAERLEARVQQLIARLVIPKEWHEAILAYYFTEDGLGEFERENYNLRKSLKRHQELYLAGQLSKVEYQKHAQFITGRLDALKPSAHYKAREIQPCLDSFPELWQQLNNGEKRVLLGTIFASLYFDRNGELRHFQAHEPFDEMLEPS